jgi:hypothetical protein
MSEVSTDSDGTDQTKEAGKARRPYVAPELIRLGLLRKLTRFTF